MVISGGTHYSEVTTSTCNSLQSSSLQIWWVLESLDTTCSSPLFLSLPMFCWFSLLFLWFFELSLCSDFAFSFFVPGFFCLVCFALASLSLYLSFHHLLDALSPSLLLSLSFSSCHPLVLPFSLCILRSKLHTATHGPAHDSLSLSLSSPCLLVSFCSHSLICFYSPFAVSSTLTRACVVPQPIVCLVWMIYSLGGFPAAPFRGGFPRCWLGLVVLALRRPTHSLFCCGRLVQTSHED